MSQDVAFRHSEELKVRDFSGTFNEGNTSEGNDSADWELASADKPEVKHAGELRTDVQKEREVATGVIERCAKETEEDPEVERFAHFGLEADDDLDHVINDSRPPTSW